MRSRFCASDLADSHLGVRKGLAQSAQ